MDTIDRINEWYNSDRTPWPYVPHPKPEPTVPAPSDEDVLES